MVPIYNALQTRGGGQGPGFKFQRMQSRVSRAVARFPPKNAQTSVALRRLGAGHGATPASRPRVEASVSSWPRTSWMRTPSQMRKRAAMAANAPREAATNAIAGPASPHVATSTSLAMLRIVPPTRIAPCVENWDRTHRPMETSVLGVCERSDIVAVSETKYGVYRKAAIGGCNVRLTRY